MNKHNSCPVEDTIQFLGQKWTMLIIRQIQLQSPIRFNQLLTNLNDISPRTLSKRLQELEEYGFIIKKKFNEIPPRVEYSLTHKGKDYGSFFEQFNELILKHNK